MVLITQKWCPMHLHSFFKHSFLLVYNPFQVASERGRIGRLHFLQYVAHKRTKMLQKENSQFLIPKLSSSSELGIHPSITLIVEAMDAIFQEGDTITAKFASQAKCHNEKKSFSFTLQKN